MEKFRLICGVDVSKSDLAIALLKGEKILDQFSVSNDESGLEALSKKLTSWESDAAQVLICLEHTGIYIEGLTQRFAPTDYCVWVVNPLMIKYARVNFDRLKTDPADAKKIAEYGYLFQLKAKDYRPLDPLNTQIKDLYLLRGQLVKVQGQLKNFEATNQDRLDPRAINTQIWTDLIAQIKAAIDEVESQLNALCKQDQQLKRYHQILRSIPGIGPVSAWQLIYTTQGFQRFPSHKQFAAYAGIAPFACQSGSSIHRKPKLSPKACREIKTNLTMGAVSQIRPKMVFEKYYHYMKRKQNKPHLWIINSIRNTIVKLAFDLIKKDQLFDLEIFLKNKKSWQKCLTLS